MSGPNRIVAYLGLGGNIGDPAAAMAEALRRMAASDHIEIAAVSPLYSTPPWGRTDQPDFLNAVAEIRTTLAPSVLLTFCLKTERALKRVRRERWGPRLIDIDILLYGNRVISADGLQIPHPRIRERAFVLVPLAEIAPDVRIDGQTVRRLLENVDSQCVVRLDNERKWWSELPSASDDSSRAT